MPDYRAFAPGLAADATEIRLNAEESHHLVAVNRCGRGDPVIAFDGGGREWRCECVDPSKGAALLRIREAHAVAARPHDLTLAQALPKGPTMDDIVRQATELGVARLAPLLSERTQVHLDGERAERKVEKWRVTAIEAAKQCGNPWLPAILPVQRFADYLPTAKDQDLRLVASLHPGAASLKKVLSQFRAKHGRAPRQAVWLVGPEGDFSPDEMTAAVMAGFSPVSLGPLVLRCDTAAVFALSVLACEMQS